jgi:hypothetical protein
MEQTERQLSWGVEVGGTSDPGRRMGIVGIDEATYANDLQSFQSSVLLRLRFFAADVLSSSKDRTDDSICS